MSSIGKDSISFDSLSLVEKPNSPLNSPHLPQTLEGSIGYLKCLPLRAPNAITKIPSTISSMVNILTSSEAAAKFDAEITKAAIEQQPPATQSRRKDRSSSSTSTSGSGQQQPRRKEGEPDPVYSKSTSQLMKSQLSKANSRSGHSKAPSILGHVVKPGSISFYTKNGQTFAVTEGRWWLMKSPIKASWLNGQSNVSLNGIHIKAGRAHILTVLPGEVGMIRSQGTEELLDVGTHVFNSGTVTINGKYSYSEERYFHHGRFHYCRVDRGQFAKVWSVISDENGAETVMPRLLGQGTHCIDNNLFRFDGFVKCSEAYIAHGSIHRVSVDKGHVGKCIQDNKPRILGEGDHLIESVDFKWCGYEDVTKSHFIVHGTITILRVTRGKIALAWLNNEPMFISEPGLYEFDSPDFSFDSFRDAEERLIQLGAKKIIRVQTGEVGVTYDDGVLKILNNGTHEINSSTWVVHRFLSTQEKSIRLATLSASAKELRSTVKENSKKKSGKDDFFDTVNHIKSKMDQDDADLTICETKDLVKVGIRADVFYSVADPNKCILKIDTDEIEDLVRETAVATLTNIIRSTALNQIAQSKHVSAGGAAEDIMDTSSGAPEDDERLRVKELKMLYKQKSNEEAPPPSAPMAEFFDKTHDEFLSKLHDDFLSRYGINISNIRIEAFKIMDNDLAEQISKHALTTAQIENEMANLEGMSLISTQKEKTAAEVKSISTKAEVLALKTAADAENMRLIDAAKADAEAVLLKAKAEAESIKLKAEAEAERAEKIAKTDLGKQEALLAIYSNMIIKANEGVEKIVYLDPSVNKDSPFALSSMYDLNQDLHSLTKLGIASNGASNGSKRQ